MHLQNTEKNKKYYNRLNDTFETIRKFNNSNLNSNLNRNNKLIQNSELYNKNLTTTNSNINIYSLSTSCDSSYSYSPSVLNESRSIIINPNTINNTNTGIIEQINKPIECDKLLNRKRNSS